MPARSKTQLTLLAGTVLLLGFAVNARADYFFNFNSLVPDPLKGDQSAAIAAYMNGVIGCANCVTVSGLTAGGLATTGVAVAQKYSGDGHVVGPGTGATSLTLGNTDGATASNSNSTLNGSYDSYLSNVAADSTGANPVQLSQGIMITFTNGYKLTGTFSFDFEVFPDGNCSQADVTHCGAVQGNGKFLNLPDLDFSANGSSPVNTVFWGVSPGTAPIGSTHSPISGSAGTELAPQMIGTFSTTLVNATQLSFLDWPAAIGIDNLKLVTPEPKDGVFLLAGLALIGLVGNKLRQRRALVKS